SSWITVERKASLSRSATACPSRLLFIDVLTMIPDDIGRRPGSRRTGKGPKGPQGRSTAAKDCRLSVTLSRSSAHRGGRQASPDSDRFVLTPNTPIEQVN